METERAGEAHAASTRRMRESRGQQREGANAECDHRFAREGTMEPIRVTNGGIRRLASNDALSQQGASCAKRQAVKARGVCALGIAAPENIGRSKLETAPNTLQ
eukprot:4314265-Pleurochrysis_carterae.AAC.4